MKAGLKAKKAHFLSHSCLGSPGTERGIFCRYSDKDGEECASWQKMKPFQEPSRISS